MRIYECIALLVLLAYTYAKPLVLTDDDFASKISELPIVLVKFYAPWCGHCQRLAPEFEAASETLASHDPPVYLAKVDCTTESGTCLKFDVSGYPTLKIFKNGEYASDYEGGRQADEIINYMISQSQPPSKLLHSIKDFEKMLSGDTPVFVSYSSSEDDQLIVKQSAVAGDYSGKVIFAHTTDPSVIGAAKDASVSRLYRPAHLRSKFEDDFVTYEGEKTSTNIKKFIDNNAIGLCGHRMVKNVDFFGSSDVIVFYHNIDYEKNSKGSAYWRNRVLRTIKDKEFGKLKFAISDAREFERELSEFGVVSIEESLPIVAVRSVKGEKFAKTKVSWNDFEQFIKDYSEGKLKPYMKSEELPTEQTAVKKVVAKNFDDIVNDPTKDVLIEFYAPWCGHCQSLKPKYEAVAEKLSKEPGITIAAMDATANDVPKTFDVRGFPTIYFVPKNKKSSPIAYQRAREVDDFVKFIAETATDELVSFDRQGREKKSEL